MNKIKLFFMVGLASASLYTAHANAGRDDIEAESIPSRGPTRFEFSPTCSIECRDKGVVSIRDGSEALEFDETNKPVFTNSNGEAVMEYSGVATDKNLERSWAKAIFQPNGSSDAHHHNGRTEDYFITAAEKGMARIRVGDVFHDLSAGDQIRINPGVTHQVVNLSTTTPLELFVKCYPSWVFDDVHPEKSN